MSARPGSPIGERVRKRRRGLPTDAEDDTADTAQEPTPAREFATPPPVTPHTPPATPAIEVATPPSTPGVIQRTPALSPASTASDHSSVRTPPPYAPPSPLSPSPLSRTEKTRVDEGMVGLLAVRDAGLSPSPLIAEAEPSVAAPLTTPLATQASKAGPEQSGAPDDARGNLDTTLLPATTISTTPPTVTAAADSVEPAAPPAPVIPSSTPAIVHEPATVAPPPIIVHDTATDAAAVQPAIAHDTATDAAAVQPAIAHEPATVAAAQPPTVIAPAAVATTVGTMTAGGPTNNPVVTVAQTNNPALAPPAVHQVLGAAAQPLAALPQIVLGGPTPNVVPANAQLVPHTQVTAGAVPAAAAQNAPGLPVHNGVQGNVYGPPHVPVQAAQAPPPAMPLGPGPIAPAVPQLLPGFEDVPAAVRALVLNIADMSFPAQHVYGLSTVPRRLDWGKGRLERRLAEGISTTYVRYPGRVRTTWFFGRSGEPQSRVNVGVNLMYDTHEQAMDILYKKAKPPAAVPEIVFASRLQGQRQRGSFTETIVPFKNVFDARDGILAKTEDRRLNAVDFTDNDVIVVEAEFTRWKKTGSSGWSAFDVGFELAAIFLLWDSY
ncbi:hypothetical protein K466DRAFT_569935 [Polyporus arcularius HHB13444]|uniref:Uncharacterized protein n=1 Tax=Polyporus arcularius HHB13444 TaxID=1314778 RepID=A0A5C3NRE2_9APHY|nr:hypothetical protein K466DRAFT_569935 [Polyporus arcularius HHB13444]